MNSRKIVASVIAPIVAVLMLAPGPGALASPLEPINDPEKARANAADAPPPGAVIGSTLSLRTPTPKGAGTNATTPVPLNNTTTLSDSGSRVVQPPGGIGGEITTGFTSSVYGGAGAGSVTVSGKSYARWLGTTPREADAISLTDKFWVANAGASVSFPPGVGFSGGGGEASLSNEFGPAWESFHDYADVKFDGVLFSYSQTSTGGFRFGSQTFYVSSDE